MMSVKTQEGKIVLPDFPFQMEYIKPDDDMQEFYDACYSRSIYYDRATGYFSENIFIILWSQIIDFAERGGKIRLLCSPLQKNLGQIIEAAYVAKGDTDLAQQIKDEFSRLLEDTELASAAKALAGLIVEGILEIKFVTPDNARGIFHHKEGMFCDDVENKILFKGSMNETFYGLDPSGNLEHIDTYTNWKNNEENNDRITSFEKRFESYWENRYPDVTVTSFPEASRLFVSEIDSEWGSDWKKHAEESALKEEEIQDLIRERKRDLVRKRMVVPIELWEHQADALKIWEEKGFRGVFKHATGSGKTRTAIKAIRDHSETGGHTLVVVPTKELLEQWEEALKEFQTPNQRIHLCGSGHAEWKNHMFYWLKSSEPQVVVAIQNTAQADEFVFRFNRKNKPVLLIGDEVHNLGAPTFRKIFNIESDKRLGLSATPERAGDEDGTQAIFEHFGEIIHTYPIEDAIRDGHLVNYLYYPEIIQLDVDEQEEWDRISQKIGKSVAIHGSWKSAWKNDPYLKMKVLKRSRIAKKAAGKIPKAVEIFSRESKTGQRWLFYCEDTFQIEPLVRALKACQSNLAVFEFHGNMKGGRAETLREFEANGGALVSCGILDEGVNIPDASHALILASSQNPREYIQRRGRVLRHSKDGSKTFANIYDVLVVPQPPVDVNANPLIAAEIKRALEFCEHAQNFECKISLMEQLSNLQMDLSGFNHYIEGIEDEGN
jgi:superfamily II DNA or RNA helicase